jgi:sensor histidine kinase regulating citrate/malate metabolism
MSTIHKPWSEVKKQIDDLISELQTWRDYEEEVSENDPEFADMLTTGIDGLLPLMPTQIPSNY